MTRRVVEKLRTKKICVDFSAPIEEDFEQSEANIGFDANGSRRFKLIFCEESRHHTQETPEGPKIERNSISRVNIEQIKMKCSIKNCFINPSPSLAAVFFSISGPSGTVVVIGTEIWEGYKPRRFFNF